jgi:hypothetical protein
MHRASWFTTIRNERERFGGNCVATEASELIRAFVRGERSWRALEQAGIYIEVRDDRYEIDNPWRLIVETHLRDVAEGLLAFRRTDDQLQRWASIILAGSSFLDLGGFEKIPEGNVLLNALWDASFGDVISQDAVNVALRTRTISDGHIVRVLA